jgi:hypothetical protein
MSDHGELILSDQDIHIARCVTEWISIVRRDGGPQYEDAWLPCEVDFRKSRLFWRLRSGSPPLPSPPPTCYSYPWYELVEEPGWAHWVHDGGHTKDGGFAIAQCRYDVVTPFADSGLVSFGPWQFAVWKSDHRDSGRGGWSIQLQPKATP